MKSGKNSEFTVKMKERKIRDVENDNLEYYLQRNISLRNEVYVWRYDSFNITFDIMENYLLPSALYSKKMLYTFLKSKSIATFNGFSIICFYQ